MNANATEDYWDSIARASLRDDLDIQQRIITISILQRNQEIKNVDKRITAWLTHFEPLIERWLAILANMRSATNLSFIMFYVAVRELYDLTALISQSN
jgi:glutamate dehydrogenase